MVDEKDLYTDFIKEATTNSSCKISKGEKESTLSRWKRLGIKWMLKHYYWKIRKKVGSAIIGNPRYGKGILFMIPLNHMDKGQQNAFWDGRKMLGHAGISCDSCMGCSGELELEYDWSTYGAYLKCIRCGYDTRDNVKEHIAENKKEHEEYLAGKNSDHAQAEVCKSGKCRCLNDIREELGY